MFYMTRLGSVFIIIIFFLISPSPLLAQSQSPSDDDTVVGQSGDYPSELPEGSDLEIEANRDEFGNIQQVPKPGFSKDLRITSQTQNETRPNYFVMEGYVDMSYQDFRLQADHAEYNTATKDLIATGNVVLDQTASRIICSKLELNLDTKMGTAYDVFGYVAPQIFFWGNKLEKLGEDEYRLHKGVFTECSQIIPHWSLKTNAATMTMDEYIRFNSFLLKAKEIPIFYSPFMMWPIKRDRATGFLFPGFGPNSRKGFYIGNSFFWAMNRSMDSTYWLDHYQLRGWGGGAEYRYAESETSEGTVKGYFANDTELGKQWTLSGAVKQDLPYDFRLTSLLDTFSSFEYIRDSAQSLPRASSQTKTVQAFLTRNWSYYSLNVLGNQSERGANDNDTSFYYHIPEVEFLSRNQQLASTGLFWTLQSSFDLLGRGNRINEETFRNTFDRYDMFPSLSFPITYLSWLTFTPSFGYRVTNWTKQIQRIGNRPEIVDQDLTRNYMDVTLDIRGPNFSKIFDTPGMGYSQKWKHAIEPQVTFHYRQDIPERPNIIVVDSDVDSIFGERVVTYSLTNILYAKRPIKPEKEYETDEYQFYNPKPLEPAPETALEFLSWRLEQTYSFQSDVFDLRRFPDLRRFSDLRSFVRFNPTPTYSVQFRTFYNVQETQLTQVSLAATLKGEDHWYVTTNYTYSNPLADVIVLPGQLKPKAGNALQFYGGFGLWKNRLALNGDFGYDFTSETLLGSGFGVTYNDDCFSIGFQYKQFSRVYRLDGKERAFTFTVALPNIGNFVSFQGGGPPRKF
jgi:LPS-assembly protein